ncbi:hypothetical protein TruAng_009904 [Truncatella angustata]|nr:hypothetical protein TruAng_009904 [Truncatella angustata]
MKILGRIDGSIYGAIRSSRCSHSHSHSHSQSYSHSSVSRAIHFQSQSSAPGQKASGNGKGKLKGKLMGDGRGKRSSNSNSNSKLPTSIAPAPASPWHSTSKRISATNSVSQLPVSNIKISNSPYSTITSPAGRPQRPLRSKYFTSSVPAPPKRNWNHTSSADATSMALPPGFTPQVPVFAALPAPQRSREELLSFLDYYDDATTVEDQLEYLKDPYMRKYAPAETLELRVSDRYHELTAPSADDVQKADFEEQQIITKLRTAVFTKLMRAHSTDNDYIYDLYRSLPQPRITYLPARLRHGLLAALSITERRNPKSMLRYFAVVADVKNAGFTLTRTEWNTAMSFASRYVGHSTDTEAEAALHLWREMEHDAGVKGNEVTFNILFDVATKAGKLALAEMTYQEMTTRRIPFNRYHHVSLIHFFGLKMDSIGIRAAYKEMVDHGEVIDHVVLNCVMASFLRCGEESAAEHVYRMMKLSDERSKLIPHRDYTFNKMVTKVLLMFGRMGRKDPELRGAFQAAGVVTPDLNTYRILLNYYGVRCGEMLRVAQFLDEMKFFRVPLHGAVFLALFKGFAIHGGPNSQWSVQRLTSVWTAFLDAYDGGADGLYISTWMAMWTLRAFAKCSGSREQILEVYEDLRIRWPADHATDSFMLDFLHKLLLKNGLSVNTMPQLR